MNIIYTVHEEYDGKQPEPSNNIRLKETKMGGEIIIYTTEIAAIVVPLKMS